MKRRLKGGAGSAPAPSFVQTSNVAQKKTGKEQDGCMAVKYGRLKGWIDRDDEDAAERLGRNEASIQNVYYKKYGLKN